MKYSLFFFRNLNDFGASALYILISYFYLIGILLVCVSSNAGYDRIVGIYINNRERTKLRNSNGNDYVDWSPTVVKSVSDIFSICGNKMQPRHVLAIANFVLPIVNNILRPRELRLFLIELWASMFP